MNNLLKLFALLSLSLIATSSHAQNKSKGFFEEGFASKGMVPAAKEASTSMPTRVKSEPPKQTQPQTTAPVSNVAPTAATTDPATSKPKTANEILQRQKAVIEQVKAYQQKIKAQGQPNSAPPTVSNSTRSGFDLRNNQSTNVMDSFDRSQTSAKTTPKITEDEIIKSIAANPKIAKQVPITKETKVVIRKSLQAQAEKDLAVQASLSKHRINPAAGTLSLVVSLSPQPELEQHIRELARLARDRGIPASRVTIVTGNASIKEIFGPQGMPLSSPLVEDINLLKSQTRVKFKLETSTGVPEKYTVKTSPTWIISAGGIEHVFEGTTRPASLYDTQGAFMQPKNIISQDDKNKTAYYNRFSNGSPFPTAKEISVEEAMGLSPQRKQEIASQLLKDAKKLPEKKVLKVKELPDCSTSQTVKIPTPFQSSRTNFDLLYFSAKSRTQQQKAKNWNGAAIPYQGNVEFSISQLTKNPTAAWADALSIRCLPTRFRVESEGNERYIRYDEGENAWDTTSNYR